MCAMGYGIMMSLLETRIEFQLGQKRMYAAVVMISFSLAGGEFKLR